MEESHGRIPPNNLDAESSVLGSILLDNEAYHSLDGRLSADMFYKEANRKIFAVMEHLIQKGNPVDSVTMVEELRTRGQLDEVGGVAYLVGLSDSVPTSVYAKFYGGIVVEKANLRGLIAASSKIMQLAYDEAVPVEDLMDRAEKLIFEIAQKKSQQSFMGMKQLVNETFEFISQLTNNPGFTTGVPTGFRDLDEMTTGLQPGSLNVIAARPSMGKTAFALSIAQNVAIRQNKTVAVFSLEMPAAQLVLRMLCSEARVDMNRVRQGALNERDFERLVNAAAKLTEAPLYIDDVSELNISELRSKSRRLMAEHDLSLIVIDYMQLMSGSGTSRGGGENRQQEISTISRGLKSLARELNIPVIVLSQLSRQVEARPNHRPMLSDLRECVTGDTLVMLSNGQRTPIRELVGQQPEVLALTPDERLVRATSDMVWSVGVKPVFALRLSSGRTLRCTAQHRVYGASGWVRLEDVKLGNRLAVVDAIVELSVPLYARENVQTEKQTSSDLFWDEVVEIVAAGEEEVFDLTVPGASSWLADGIVSHNSGAIEQDADLVAFIYRDEYYDKASEKQGIAEIIIGKQRNGPVGTAELQFHSQHVRFNDLARDGA